MKIIDTKLPGVKIIEPRIFGDTRGFFFESYQQKRYQDSDIALPFVQSNVSRSKCGVLRGLHYQLKYPQGKLVMVTFGEVYDVAVDIRVNSPTFGQWISVILSDKNHRQLYVPPGFAHGFCSLSEQVDFHYSCTDYYHPEDECGIIWNAPGLNIDWPKLDTPLTIADKDKLYKPLAETPKEYLPSI
jgi:dTDP-4-dehydrorhamnose 3,5-epimerase